MIISAGLRRIVLLAHVATSVGWFGAVAAFLALAVAGMTSQAPQMVRGAYLAMELTTWIVIVPLAFASLLTGVVASLGTRWGLFRYYWVLIKLLLTTFATVILMVHTQPVDLLAAAAAKTAAFGPDLQGQQRLMVIASGAALAALLLLTGLSVYKPPGLTRYGLRRLRADSRP